MTPSSPKIKAAPGGRLAERFERQLVVFVAGALPGNQLADRGTRARHRLLVGFDFRARGFFAHGADAKAYFLLFRIHLDDFEVMLQAWLQMQRLSVFVGRFRLVAEAFHAFSNFDKGAESGDAEDFAMNYIPDVVRREE